MGKLASACYTFAIVHFTFSDFLFKNHHIETYLAYLCLLKQTKCSNFQALSRIDTEVISRISRL